MRRLLVVLAAAVLIAIGVATVAVVHDDGGTERRGATSPDRSSQPLAVTAAPVDPPQVVTEPTNASRAVVQGIRGGPPPCATDDAGTYAAETAHPERAPLQQEATFVNGERWALCGASIVFSGELLNLRSSDDGATWTVTQTPMSASSHHAGDSVAIDLTTPSNGRVNIHIAVAPDLDASYLSDDGGMTWTRQ